MTRYCNEQRERDKACCRTNGGALCESVCQVAGPNSTACTVCRLAALALVLACEQTSDNLHDIRMRYGNVPDSRTESAFMLLSAGDDRTIELQCNPMPALRIKDRQLRSLLELSLVGSPIRGKSPTTGSTWFYPAPRK
jgi:hypothetical protein